MKRVQEFPSNGSRGKRNALYDQMAQYEIGTNIVLESGKDFEEGEALRVRPLVVSALKSRGVSVRSAVSQNDIYIRIEGKING